MQYVRFAHRRLRLTVIEFFKRIVEAKLKNESVTIDWYKNELLSPELSKNDIAIHSGLNMKTISNMYNSATRQIVLNASLEHYETLRKAIEALTSQGDVDIILTIKFRGVSVELNVFASLTDGFALRNESLIVINTIAVKRSALRGGLWSTAGKQVEKPLLTALCTLFRVPVKYFDQSRVPESLREVDFYLIDDAGKFHRCEVKLMGKGNPESADVVIARDSAVFIADKLSDLNKKQLDGLGVKWVELRDENGYKRFGEVLKALSIPCKPYRGNVQKALDKILLAILSDEIQTTSTKNMMVQEVMANYSSSGLLVDFDDEI